METIQARLMKWDREGRADIYATFPKDQSILSDLIKRAKLALEVFPEIFSVSVPLPPGAIRVMATDSGDAISGAAFSAKAFPIEYEFIGVDFEGPYAIEKPELLMEAEGFDNGQLEVSRRGVTISVCDEMQDYPVTAYCAFDTE